MLEDFFMREVVAWGQLDPDDGQLHTGEEAAEMTAALVARFDREALVIAPVARVRPERAPSVPAARVPAVRVPAAGSPAAGG